MAFFASAVLVQIILTLTFQAVVLYKCYQMFTKRLLRTSATPVLRVFFGYLATVSTTTIIHCVYMIALWRPFEIIYDGPFMYITGGIPYVLLISNPVYEFALCVERCCVIAFPHTYYHNYKKSMAFGAFFFTIITVVCNAWVNGFIWLPPEGLSWCRFFSCMISGKFST